MKQYRILTAVFLVIFIGGGIFHFFRKSLPEPQKAEKETEALRIVLPDAQSFSKESGAFPYYKAYKTSARTESDLVGFAFLTADIAPEINGFAGPIHMLIGMDLNGRIVKVHILSHSETSAYLVKLDEFLAQFVSKGWNDPLTLGADIDGITRATITSDAITRTVSQSLKKAGSLILQREASQSVIEKKPLPLDQIFVPLVLFAVAVFGVRSHNPIARWTALLGGLLYFGILKATMVSANQIVNISLLQFPSFEQSPLWYMLIGLTLLTTPLFGMVFCGSLCPFATVQELLYNLFHPNKKPRKHVIAYGLDQRARYLKYLVLFSVMAASIFLGNSSAAGIEPYLTLFTLQATFWGWALLAFMLLAAIFYFRFWCKYFCPVGACLGLIARISLFKIKLGTTNCTHCELCDKTCPTRAIRIDEQNLPKIDHPECILCGKCVRICRAEKISSQGATHE